MTGVLTVDAGSEPTGLDLSAAERWHILVLHNRRPVARIDLASPGATVGEALLSASVLRWADWEAARDELTERLRRRLQLPQPAQGIPSLSHSVVVCTHRRPDDIPRLLAALRHLDPAPTEIVVVDNDPGEQDCRAAVLAAGGQYVREECRGLNNARNAGVRAAKGDIVVFTDDDCVTPPGWLARLDVEFANPVVGAVTGPAFPHALDTPSRRRMERQASLARGLQRLEFDWTVFPVPGAGAIGVGANMAFRRELLTALGPLPFPPELDAGTITESGGDTYVIAKLLAHGHRVVYDPSMFIYHRHREDARALHKAVFGYGVGLGAALTKLLVEDRELSTPATWLWLITQYRKTQQKRLAGHADRVETRLAWDYVRGGICGPSRWRRARREAAVDISSTQAIHSSTQAIDPTTRTTEPATRTVEPPTAVEPITAPISSSPPPSVKDAADLREDPPVLSVIVPTHERPRALERCLRALVSQTLETARFEVIVVDDSANGGAQPDAELNRQLHLSVIRAGGSGAAAARNAGAAAAVAPLLLFLDDDVVAQPDLLQRHLERHEQENGETIVVGAYPPRPVSRSLPANAAVLWWSDLFQALQQSPTHTYVGALTGNMSISKRAFERSGRFDLKFGRYRREDWEWGLRALKCGLSIGYEPAACGLHEYSLDTPGRLKAAELEGHGDALFLREDPEAGSAVLPLIGDPPAIGGPLRKLQRIAWDLPLLRRMTTTVLAGLEWGNLRLQWVRLFNAAQRLSYERGARAGGVQPGEPLYESLLDLDLDGVEPIPVPSLTAPTLRIRVGGQEVARVSPALGLWTPDLAEQIMQATPWPAIEQAATSLHCVPQRYEDHDHMSSTQVIFGPAHSSTDAVNHAQLTAAGVVVSFVEGEPAKHWFGIAQALQADGPALVALTMPGVQPDRRWLTEALVAFDGPRVGVVLGRAISDEAPPAPLVLHSHMSAGEEPQIDAAIAPQYIILRRELLPALAVGFAGYGPLGPTLGLVEDALQGGWIVGYRDVHGLLGEGPNSFEGARALTAIRTQRSPMPRVTARTELRRTTLLALWHIARGHGRRSTGMAYAGALAGLAARRIQPPTSEDATATADACAAGGD